MKLEMNLKLRIIASGLLCFFCVLLGPASQLFARTPENEFDIRLRDGQVMRIQICSPDIVRIRLSETGEFRESLMERYGIVKTDWEQEQAILRTEKGKQVVTAPGFQVSVSPRSGEVSISDRSGKLLVGNISVAGPKAPETGRLAQSLNSYFGKVKQGQAIIGSGKGPAETGQLEEVGNISASRVIAIPVKAEERFYGGGSTSRNTIQHRGSVLRMWATYQKTEIPMPFLMSTEGWGIFNHTTAKNYFDIGRFQNDRLYIFNTGGDVDFYLMFGSSMPDLINLFTTITGKPYLMPKWGYGLAFGGNMMEDQLDIMNDAVRFRDEHIPCDIFWLEPQWMKKRYDFSTEKNWNLEKFPAEPYWEVDKFPKYEAPTLFISKLHGLGFKLALWLCINHDMTVAEEDRLAVKDGKKQSGQEHWFRHLTRFMDQGIDGFKLDPAHTLDEHPDLKYYNGYTDKEMHNLNQVLLSKQMYETFREHKGIRSFHHYCGGYAGTQHWGVSTSGDNGGGRDALFDQLNLGLSGFVNTSADVLEGVTDNIAGMHLGFFLPWIQVNSWYSLHHPWYMNPLEKEAFRFYAQLRNSLFPYIYSAAVQGSQTGMPILRAMPLVFPNDRHVDNMIYQYMFGENLLVGVFSDSLYLPEGTWINYWTGEKLKGGDKVFCKIPENRGGPLFIRSGAIIPFRKPMNYIGEKKEDSLVLRVYPEKNSLYTLWEDDGISFEYEKGIIAKTRIECADSEKETRLTIHPAVGSYEGMAASRSWELELFIPERPSKLWVNGSDTDKWRFEESGRVIVPVFQEDVREKVIVEVLKNL